jgi:polysaccharide export outer membrane protein
MTSGLLALVVLCLGACASSAPPPAAPAAAPEFTDEYRIGVGDVLSVNVGRNEDLSVQVPVRPDGKISVPLAGDVMVGDKTPEEVAAEITERLATYIRDPYVTVIVTDMGSDEYRSRVRVTGAVENPASLPYRQGMTVLDLVLEAGGPTEFANTARSTLFSRSGKRRDIRLDRILNRGDMSTNYPLSPGDVVTVPERAF